MDKFDSHKVLGLVSIGFHWFPDKQHGFHRFFMGATYNRFLGPLCLMVLRRLLGRVDGPIPKVHLSNLRE